MCVYVCTCTCIYEHVCKHSCCDVCLVCMHAHDNNSVFYLKKKISRFFSSTAYLACTCNASCASATKPFCFNQCLQIVCNQGTYCNHWLSIVHNQNHSTVTMAPYLTVTKPLRKQTNKSNYWLLTVCDWRTQLKVSPLTRSLLFLKETNQLKPINWSN